MICLKELEELNQSIPMQPQLKDNFEETFNWDLTEQFN